MHPEFLREMTDQRGREMRARARQARLARLARLVGRRGGGRPGAVADAVADEFVIPAIPDYVDGTFGPTAGEPAGTSQAPTARHAA